MLIVVVCSSFNLSCSLLALRKNLQEIQKFATVGGAVDSGAPAGTPTVVVLMRSDGSDVIDSFVLGPMGKYFFVAPAGSYRIAAFVDPDRNLTFDPATERGMWYGAPEVLTLAGGQVMANIDLRFTAPKVVALQQPLTAPDLGKRGTHDLPDINLGTVVSADDSRFSAENGQLGMWQPVDFALRQLPGIYFLEPFDPDKIPVLFVHGVGGFPSQFATLISRMDRKHFQPWLLFYPSGVRLDTVGHAGIRWISGLALKYPFTHLIVIAHSMGGLASRSMINQWVENSGDKRTVQLDAYITMSTPWGGHASAASGVERAPEVIPVWYDLAPGSNFIASLFKTNLPPETRYYLFFSYEGGSAMQASMTGGANDGVVAVSSELRFEAQESAVRMWGIPESHDGILQSKATSDHINRILADIAH